MKPRQRERHKDQRFIERWHQEHEGKCEESLGCSFFLLLWAQVLHEKSVLFLAGTGGALHYEYAAPFQLCMDNESGSASPPPPHCGLSYVPCSSMQLIMNAPHSPPPTPLYCRLPTLPPEEPQGRQVGGGWQRVIGCRCRRLLTKWAVSWRKQELQASQVGQRRAEPLS